METDITLFWRELLNVVNTIEEYEELLFYYYEQQKNMTYGIHIVLRTFTSDLMKKNPEISLAIRDSYRRFLEQLNYVCDIVKDLQPLSLNKLESDGLDKEQYKQWLFMSKTTSGYKNAIHEMQNVLGNKTHLYQPTLELLTWNVIRKNKAIKKDIERMFTMHSIENLIKEESDK